MKHLTESETARLIGLAGNLGLQLSTSDALIMLRHLDLVIEQNKTLNLTRIVSPEEAVRLHILDSLTTHRVLSEAPGGRFADLGTGAGFPGIPLSIATGRAATLVESVRKKAAAVERFVEELGLRDQIEISSLRAEELGATHPASYAAVVARALSSLPALVELASPLLVPGGLLIAMKARPSMEELQSGNTVAERVGMIPIADDEFTLPGGDETRRVIVYRREGDSVVSLPRRPGMAQRYPLA